MTQTKAAKAINLMLNFSRVKLSRFHSAQRPAQSTSRTCSDWLTLGEHDRHVADFRSLRLDRNRLPIAVSDQ